MSMRKTRHPKRSYKRVIILGIILLVLLIAGAAAFFNGGLHRKGTADSGLMTSSSEVHVMIMGVDSRKDDVGRSDTLMIATVDLKLEKAGLLSIPRDTRVKIEGNCYDKINAAYAYGGHELTKKTVESLLDVPIDYYIIIDVHAFERIIDAVGGVDIDVEKRMHYEDPWDDDGGLVIDLYPGEQHMGGKKAIQYVRYRDGEGDIGRIGRQQKFMKAVLEQVLSPQILPKLPDILKEVSSAVKTDMSLQDMLNFASLLKKVHDNGLTAEMVPGKPAYLQDISYWIPDIPALRKMLAEEIGIAMNDDLKNAANEDAAEYKKSLPKDITLVESSEKKRTKDEAKDAPAKPNEISVLVINSSGINGAGAQAAAALQKKGFIISGVETGKTSSREQTTITTSTQNTELFYGMPFTCTIMSGGEKNQAVLNIGRDYKKK